MNSKTQKLLEIRKHPSFGVHLSPLFTVPKTLDDAPPLPDPGVTGSVAPADINTLFTIASFPSANWDIPASFSAFDINEFSQFVSLKTGLQPSYYTAYQQALAMFNTLIGEFGIQQALVFLYTTNPSPLPANWLIVRYWVIQEFLSLFITSGNFRYYGWVNYPGWMGGPYNDPAHLPYRT